jgi:carbon-monoxide dehydrogenase small subunit
MKRTKTLSLSFTCNGRHEELEAPAHRTLLQMLRDDLQLTGTKEGCGHGECGACTVIVDGEAVNACIFPAAELNGKSVTTIEGLRQGDRLHPVQQAFIEESGYQCGFCTAGAIVSTTLLLERNPNPTREEIQDALAGNFCRCTGYAKIFESVEAAAKMMSEGR